MRQAANSLLLILIPTLGTWISPAHAADGPAAPAAGGSSVAFTLDRPTPSKSVPSATATRFPYKQVRGAAGFWRVAQTHAGVWWFVSPADQTEFLNTVTTVQPYQVGRDKDGPAFISGDYDGGLAQNGNLDAWAEKTLVRVRETGFKGLGAWSHPVFHKSAVPMSRDLNVYSWMHGAARRFYSPEFAQIAEQAIKSQVEPLRDNTALVGYFIDNELDWGDLSAGPGVFFDYLAPADPNRAEVIRVIRSVWKDLDAFNRDWQTKVGDWAELEKWNTLPRQPLPAYARLFSAWIGHYAADYFKLTTDLIRKYDPNHLILGVRYKAYALREVVKASAPHTDVQSINYYSGDGRLDAEQFRMLHELSGQPVLVSEYSFHALDGRSGNRNTVGFAAQVLDQKARADGYELMTTRMARVPYIVGADWFQWADEPPSGRSGDGEDANFGVVDIDDKPYDPLVDAVKRTGPKLNGLHGKSHKDEHVDVWRESFADKPVARVPYLDKPLRVNGELSDWPAAAKVEGIRHAQTIGLERSKIPLPNVYLGWRDDGLYVAAEVFDDDIQGAPAQGWWWTRDTVEFWVSTKPVASDQTAYDKHSHQFFFVPNNFPAEDGIAGTVGRYKRDGDGLKESLIPHRDVRQVTRIFPNRYVIEMFIPAKAMTGWEPRKQPAMAFNIHVRNFQHALDYFWSAPKEVFTQLRPNTWGPMYMEQPGQKATEAEVRRGNPTPVRVVAKPAAVTETAAVE